VREVWVSRKQWEALEKRVALLETKITWHRYEVKKGDTFVSISLEQYGTEAGYEFIAKANDLSPTSPLCPGQLLWLPSKSALKLVGFHE
jgi:nucleoid-associated protein YgaU